MKDAFGYLLKRDFNNKVCIDASYVNFGFEKF